MQQFRHVIYSPMGGQEAIEWQGADYASLVHTNSMTEVMAQAYKVVILPAMFNLPEYTNAYNEEYLTYDFSKFDLVLLSETIWQTFDDIVDRCVNPMGIKNFLVLSHDLQCQDVRNIYRPFWMFRILDHNQFSDTNQGHKKFLFDALLGTPRDHRVYVMARFQNNPGLLQRSVVTFRKEFDFHDAPVSDRSQQLLQNQTLNFPYVSENLDPAWESDRMYAEQYKYFLDGTDIPWDIYRNTWYSICTESADNNFLEPDQVRITEKTSRLLFAKRVFVMFGAQGTLAWLQSQGFKTFGHVIDESYDLIADPHDRFCAAFDQVEALAKADPVAVYAATVQIREHNHHRLYKYQEEVKNHVNSRLLDRIPVVHH